MADDTAHSESGGKFDGVTPATQADTRTEASQPDERTGDKDDQDLADPVSEEKANIDKPALPKSMDESDAHLLTEQMTVFARQWWESQTKRGVRREDLLTTITESLTSRELYDLWSRKLRNYAESYEKGHASETTPRLARSFIDYVGTVDYRLQQIESRIGITSTEIKVPKDAPDDEVLVQTRFYNASAQPQPQNGGMEYDEPGWNVKGSFLSEVDSRHCLRVLFNWVQDHTAGTQSLSEDEHPDPKRINISEIRIHSDAITAFLANRLDYEVDNDSIVRLKWPFRSLIGNVDFIKKQLSILEDHYRYFQNSPSISMYPGTKETDELSSLDRHVGDLPESRAAVEDLHSRSGLSVQPKPAQKDPDEGSRKQPFERKKALHDFGELVDFMDKYLGKEISLYQGYSKGQFEDVDFESLWMLFDSGELIYCHSQQRYGTLPRIYNGDNRNTWVDPLEVHTPQAYRVLATSGGIPATKGRRRAGLTFLEQSIYDQITNSGEKPGSVAVSLNRERYTPLYIDCYFVHFDGSRFRPGQNWFEFKPFEGTVKVRSLVAYPMRYRSNYSSDSLDLYERGRQFLRLTVPNHKHYDGVTLGRDREDVNSPVIIDYKTAVENNRDWDPDFRWHFMASWKDEPRQILEIPRRSCAHVDCHKSACLEDAYPAHQSNVCEKKMRSLASHLDELETPTWGSGSGLERLENEMAKMGLLDLLPGYSLAYVLRNHKWVKVDITKLSEIRQEEGWDDLVLPQGHKNLIQAMVQTHAAGSRHSQANLEVDLVRGKGKGCILLLHGEPGVGKTSTAECVALYTKRPLYPITCGDIGIDPSKVEQNLEKHFTLAHKWGCVLLLEEADVFLAKRDKFDVARNGLVSVFLRILEYYSGILFLTTNRVGILDPAFRSRIHVSLYYRKLSRNQALEIWKINLRRLHKLNEDRVQRGLQVVEFDQKSLVRYAEKHLVDFKWNGRQIRNAFQTSIALAEFEARDSADKVPRMTKKHFAKIGKTAAEFDLYLESVHGMDEDKMARRDQERATFSRRPGKTRSKRDDDDSESSDESDSGSSSIKGWSSESSDSDSDDSRAKPRKKKSKSKSSKGKTKE